MTREDFLRYRDKHYVASGTTVIIAGEFNEENIITKIENSFAGIPTSPKEGKLPVMEKQEKPNIKIRNKETDQAHIIVGVRTFPADDSRQSAVRVLNAVLGGGMSSRLFLKLR